MNVLYRFSSNENDYLLYQSRLDATLKENTYISALEQAVREKEQAVREKEQAVKEKEQAAKEAAREKKRLNDLLLLLAKKGIDPDKELRSSSAP